MRIYISGKISNVPQDNLPKFEAAECRLRFIYGPGSELVIPHRLPHYHDKKWHSFMKVDLRHMLACNQVVVLDDWKKSKGAISEVLIADLVRIPITTLKGREIVRVPLGFWNKLGLLLKVLLNLI
ncbi:MAG: DUF4406 domain-containing protein [Bacteroidia bacterium]|nr:DUF4406 domain-containing protein [Bacteroidia bacterium]